MSEPKAAARYLLPGPKFKGIKPSFGQVRTYEEYREGDLDESDGYWTEGEKLYRETDYKALQQRLALAEKLLKKGRRLMPHGHWAWNKEADEFLNHD